MFGLVFIQISPLQSAYNTAACQPAAIQPTKNQVRRIQQRQAAASELAAPPPTTRPVNNTQRQ